MLLSVASRRAVRAAVYQIDQRRGDGTKRLRRLDPS